MHTNYKPLNSVYTALNRVQTSIFDRDFQKKLNLFSLKFKLLHKIKIRVLIIMLEKKKHRITVPVTTIPIMS